MFNKNRCVPLPERKSTSEWLEPVAQKHPKHPTEVQGGLTFLTLKNEIKLSSAGICFRHDNKKHLFALTSNMLLWVYRIWRSDTQIYRNPCTKTCLLPALFFCKECVMWVSAHCGFHLPPQRHPFAVNLVMFSANSLLFLRINKPILKGWLQPNFRKRRKKKGVGA